MMVFVVWLIYEYHIWSIALVMMVYVVWLIYVNIYSIYSNAYIRTHMFECIYSNAYIQTHIFAFALSLLILFSQTVFVILCFELLESQPHC